MTSRDVPAIRVMTWNVWWRFGDWQQRHRAIVDIIERERPDVLFLQEVWSERSGVNQARLIADEIGAHVAITDDPFGARDVGFHNAILSRWPLRCDPDTDSIALPGERPDGDGGWQTLEHGFRRALWAVADTPWGPWPLLCTHLDYRFDQSAVRRRQAIALLDIVNARRGDPEQALPVLIGADCNAVPDSDEIRVLTGRSEGPHRNLVLSDVWDQRGDGHGHTWVADHPYQPHSAWPNRRIDYLFVSWPRPKPVGNPRRVWLAGADAVGGVLASDHLAVVADLQVPSAASPGV